MTSNAVTFHVVFINFMYTFIIMKCSGTDFKWHMKKKLAHIPRFRKRWHKSSQSENKFVFKWRSLIAHSLLQINIVRYISFSKWHYSSNKCPIILRQLLILMCFIFLGGWCLRASRLMAQCALLWIRGTREEAAGADQPRHRHTIHISRGERQSAPPPTFSVELG